ncbi:AIPR family protein [Culicoidibacter larvae]|uniref:Abortive phage infection protein C-terminal domain-containing protein n=1 Tax=Culicoidibacter larvae TaxID=2579976 RepID=A0A5R8QBG9_9FIRM|nr:AIPR family protein [Culicoidibacter larvae]TLG73852.1 hypothetical protein FEZ08_06875 [Culicoidibacter larvae]
MNKRMEDKLVMEWINSHITINNIEFYSEKQTFYCVESEDNKNKTINYYIFFYKDEIIAETFTKIDDLIEKNGHKRSYHICILTNDWSHLIKAKRLLEKRRGNVEYLFEKISNSFYELEITTRIDKLYYEKNDIESYVFNMPMSTLTKLYLKFGDNLFTHNVREFILKDKLDVDNSIENTLENEPENFWFFNNGIVIIANDYKIQRTNSIEIQNFSIINGAQTLTIASKWYIERLNEYNLSQDKDVLDKIDNYKKATVLVRIIKLDQNKSVDLCNKITVSLNRQKEVKLSDIMFNNKIVSDVRKQLVDLGLYIKRRGENKIGKSMYVEDFAKMYKALILQQPGASRASAGHSLLEYSGDDVKRKIFYKKEEYERGRSPYINIIGSYLLWEKNITESIDAKDFENNTILKNDIFYRALDVFLRNGDYYIKALIVAIMAKDGIPNNMIDADIVRDVLQTKKIDYLEKFNRNSAYELISDILQFTKLIRSENEKILIEIQKIDINTKELTIEDSEEIIDRISNALSRIESIFLKQFEDEFVNKKVTVKLMQKLESFIVEGYKDYNIESWNSNTFKNDKLYNLMITYF